MKKVLLPILAVVLALALTLPVAAQVPVPFTCTGQAFIVFDPASQLNQINLGVSPGFTFNIIANPINGLQINNLGYRSTDGLLYGWERNATDNAGQIVQIDSAGTVIGLGNPGLPSNQGTAYNYNAGDVSVDGSKMYLSYSKTNGSGGLLYVVDLPALTLSTVNITGGSGGVADWAAHPTDGLLYGGDHTGWELASLDPATGVRTDVNIGLPNEGTLGYGAAWFDATGRLYLYHNSGKIYAVDNLDTTPTLVGVPYPLVNLALNTSNNDGANCAAGVQEDVEVQIDIKPTSCPNPLNLKSKGVLPVAILGTENFDVTQIDPTTVRLAFFGPGSDPFDPVIPPDEKKTALEDVAAPYDGELVDCLSCWEEGPDGFLDLTLKFDKQEIIAAIVGKVEHGNCISLTLVGELFDGTAFSGSDIVRIIKKGR